MAASIIRGWTIVAGALFIFTMRVRLIVFAVVVSLDTNLEVRKGEKIRKKRSYRIWANEGLMTRQRSRRDLSVPLWSPAENKIHSLREKDIWKSHFESSRSYFVGIVILKNSLELNVMIFGICDRQIKIWYFITHKEEADYIIETSNRIRRRRKRA